MIKIKWFPELTIVVAIFSFFFLSFFKLTKKVSWLLSNIFLFCILSSILLNLFFLKFKYINSDFYSCYRVDFLGLIFKLIFLFGLLVVFLHKEKSSSYYFFVFTAVLGSFVLISSYDLLVLFVGLEILSIANYLLLSQEFLAQKLVLQEDLTDAFLNNIAISCVASCFLLYSISFFYGLTGSTNFFALQQKLDSLVVGEYSLFTYFALFFLLFGFLLKLSFIPFYNLKVTIHKNCSFNFLGINFLFRIPIFAFFLRTILVVYTPLLSSDAWKENIYPFFTFIVFSLLFIGSLALFFSRKLRSLLFYLEVLNFGILLVPLAVFIVCLKYLIIPLNALLASFFVAVFLCLLSFVVAYIGFIIILDILEENRNKESFKNELRDDLSLFLGLYQRNPFLAVALTVFLFSLSFVPFTIGFNSKTYLLMYVISSQGFFVLLLVFLAIFASYYFIFTLLRRVYSSKGNSSDFKFFKLRLPTKLALWICLAVVLCFGVFWKVNVNYLSKINWASTFRK